MKSLRGVSNFDFVCGILILSHGRLVLAIETEGRRNYQLSVVAETGLIFCWGV